MAAFPSVVEQVDQDHDILVAAVGSLHCVVSKCRGTGSSGSRQMFTWDLLMNPCKHPDNCKDRRKLVDEQQANTTMFFTCSACMI